MSVLCTVPVNPFSFVNLPHSLTPHTLTHTTVVVCGHCCLWLCFVCQFELNDVIGEGLYCVVPPTFPCILSMSVAGGAEFSGSVL